MKIFVIDDDIVARMALGEVVRSVGEQPGKLVEFQSGDDAWLELEKTFVLPFIVLCDIRMPGMSGLDLLREVKNNVRMKDLPFVMISSAGDMDTVKSALELGIIGFLVKPYSFDEARPRLQKFFAAARAKMAETPSQAQSRLKISAQHYANYLVGLRNQVASLGAQAKAAGNPQDLGLVKRKMVPLRTAAETLGIWRAVSILESMASDAATHDNLLDGLHEINQLVQYQFYSVNA